MTLLSVQGPGVTVSQAFPNMDRDGIERGLKEGGVKEWWWREDGGLCTVRRGPGVRICEGYFLSFLFSFFLRDPTSPVSPQQLTKKFGPTTLTSSTPLTYPLLSLTPSSLAPLPLLAPLAHLPPPFPPFAPTVFLFQKQHFLEMEVKFRRKFWSM